MTRETLHDGLIWLPSHVTADRDPDITGTNHRLSKPLIGDDNRIYACSGRDFFVFESNGTVAWTVHLNYTCNGDIAPVHGGKGKVHTIGHLVQSEFSYFCLSLMRKFLSTLCGLLLADISGS